MQLGLEVAAALRTGRRAPAPAGSAATTTEQVAEDVTETAAVGVEPERAAATPTTGAESPGPESARTVGADAGRDHLAHLVVLGALGLVADHVVGRGDLLEALLGLGVALVRVGVVLLGELL